VDAGFLKTSCSTKELRRRSIQSETTMLQAVGFILSESVIKESTISA